jgi:triosephosphate isomerase
MPKLVIGNWKMNPETLPQAVRLFSAIIKTPVPKGVEVVACPPFPYLLELALIAKKKKTKVALGAQDVFWEEKGTYTGEVSPSMLKSVGVRYVIVGHSERRRHAGETDEMVNKKLLAALSAGFKTVLCIGENKNVRKRGLAEVKKFVQSQLLRDLKGMKAISYKLKANRLILMYEPSWAISSGKVGSGTADNPENVLVMIRFMRNVLRKKFGLKKVRVIYGASVTSKNAASFLGQREIDGVLPGGASLVSEEFWKITEIASGVTREA